MTKEENICLSTLKSRGWTTALIDRLLPPPESVRNPHYRCAPAMKIWPLVSVEEAEKNPEFIQHVEKKNAHRQKRMENRERRLTILADALQTQNPADDYPLARSMHRHFILEVGETNTGKTHDSLETMKNSQNGIYLAPLRLLAMEVQDTMLSCGILCSMLTGEEEDIIPDAQHMSSTVEMLDLTRQYDVSIIDECQLLADPHRGGAWTRAILGLRAPVIYLCLPRHALNICTKLIQLCHDTFEIHYRERKVPLVFEGEVPFSDIQKGDAVIVFSRKGVLEMADQIRTKLGFNTGMIYGTLPYQNRKEQVTRFLNGSIDVLVSTDAIGMGMNLPIRRVVFAQTMKFNGYDVSPLTGELVKQIAGRAGRYGMYDTGYAAVLKNHGSAHVIQYGLDYSVASYSHMYVPFPEKMLTMQKWPSVENCIRTWMDIPYPDCFRKTDMSETLAKVSVLKRMYPDMPQIQMYRLSTVPFDFRNSDLCNFWLYLVRCLMRHEDALISFDSAGQSLSHAELTYRQLDLYHSFCRISGMEMNMPKEWFNALKQSVIDHINTLLLKRGKKKTT
ncbi:MAG: helicase-related protein [Bulleidia sp.]